MQTQRLAVQAAACLFYQWPAGAVGWGLSEAQWPQLATEGLVMNVQRQSRTLQRKRHQFRIPICEELYCGIRLYMCTDVRTQTFLCVKESLCVCVRALKLVCGKGLKEYCWLLLWEGAEQCFSLVIPMNPCSLRGTVGGNTEDKGVCIAADWTIRGKTASPTFRGKKTFVEVETTDKIECAMHFSASLF